MGPLFRGEQVFKKIKNKIDLAKERALNKVISSAVLPKKQGTQILAKYQADLMTIINEMDTTLQEIEFDSEDIEALRAILALEDKEDQLDAWIKFQEVYARPLAEEFFKKVSAHAYIASVLMPEQFWNYIQITNMAAQSFGAAVGAMTKRKTEEVADQIRNKKPNKQEEIQFRPIGLMPTIDGEQ